MRMCKTESVEDGQANTDTCAQASEQENVWKNVKVPLTEHEVKWYKSLLSDIPTNVQTVTLHLAREGLDREGMRWGLRCLWGRGSRKELRGGARQLLEPGASPTSWGPGGGHLGPALPWSPHCTLLAVWGRGWS